MPACQLANPAAASPTGPVIHSLSPGLAPLRRKARVAGTSPVTCTVILKGPLTVSPPTRLTPICSAKVKKPRQKPSSHASSTCGNDKLSKAQRGRAPMAAKSDKFTARLRQPTYSAGNPTGKWRPSSKRSEEHTSELQSRGHLVCRLLLEKKNKYK